jgi:hypothetical protein
MSETKQRLKPLKVAAKNPKNTGTSTGFIESMECLAVATLPDGPEWTYEIKLDGFRLEAVKTSGTATIFSRQGNVLLDGSNITLRGRGIIDGSLFTRDNRAGNLVEVTGSDIRVEGWC